MPILAAASSYGTYHFTEMFIDSKLLQHVVGVVIQRVNDTCKKHLQ